MNEAIKNFETGEEWLTHPTLVYGKTFMNHYTCHMGCFVTKKAYEKYGMYDVELRIQMDTDLLRRFSVKGARYKYIDANCGYFRRGGVSNTKSQTQRKNYERALVMKRYGASDWDVLITQMYHKAMQIAKDLLIALHIDPTKMRKKVGLS